MSMQIYMRGPGLKQQILKGISVFEKNTDAIALYISMCTGLTARTSSLSSNLQLTDDVRAQEGQNEGLR